MVVTFSLGMGPIPWVIMSEVVQIFIIALVESSATMKYYILLSVCADSSYQH